MKLKNLLSAAILSFMFALSASGVLANGSLLAAAARQQSGVVTTYHSTRAAAVRSVNSANRRGFPARMAYNSSLRKWAVQINYLKSSGTSGSTGGGGAVGAGCETALKSATVLYFPSRSMAEDIYKAHLRQGDCAKIWNAGSQGWAVAVKAITGRGLRPNRRSRSEISAPEGVKSNRINIAKAGGINSIKNRSNKSGGINSIGSRVAKAGGINSIKNRSSKAGGINSIRAGAGRPIRDVITRPGGLS